MITLPLNSNQFCKQLELFSQQVREGKYYYPQEVAMALDKLALMAWRDVRELYPNSVLLEGEVVDNTSSVPQS